MSSFLCETRKRVGWLLATVLAATCIVGQVHAAVVKTHTLGGGTVRACHIDLKNDDLRMFWGRSDREPLGTFANLQKLVADRSHTVVCASNGGMYQEDLRPLGLFVEEGRVLKRLNTRKGAYGNFYMEPNGVFLLNDDQARIVTTREYETEFAHSPMLPRFATQSGPLMLQAGVINPVFAVDSKNRRIRNAVCVVSSREVVLAISDMPVSFYEFSSFLRNQLGCKDALHLDSSISWLAPPGSAGLAPAVGVMIAVTREATQTDHRNDLAR